LRLLVAQPLKNQTSIDIKNSTRQTGSLESLETKILIKVKKNPYPNKFQEDKL
jgi:hypothetical protein